jgi:hypothetical protein
VDPAPVPSWDPDDPSATTAVLADWLSAQGDVRGLMLALASSGRDPAELERLRRRHLHRYSEGLWPVFGARSEAELGEHLELRWRAGLLIAARPLDPERLPANRLRAQLEGLLASEAAVALAELRGDLVDPSAVVEALVAGPVRPSLVSLVVGDYRTPMPKLEAVWSRVPKLRTLELNGPGIVIDGLAAALPTLAELRLRCELDPSPLRAFGRGVVFAKLRRLAIRLGGERYWEDAGGTLAELLGAVLDGSAAPALEHLSVTGIAETRAITQAVEHSALRQRLRSVEISDARG